MPVMSADDFRSLKADELEARIQEMKRQLFTMKMQLHSNQLTNNNEIKNTRRNIARALTVQEELVAKAGVAE